MLVVILAGPAYPQNKDILRLQSDMINLSNQMKELQNSVDQNNKVLLSLVGKLADETNLLNANVQKVVDVVGSVKADNEKTASDLRVLLGQLGSNVDQINQGFSGVRDKLASLSQQLTAMKSTSEPLPSPDDLFRTAGLDFLTGSYDLAISEYKELLAKFPNYPRAIE